MSTAATRLTRSLRGERGCPRGSGSPPTPAAPRSSGRPGRRRRRAGRRSGRAGTSPPCGCRRHRPTGAARRDPAGIAASRSAAYASWAARSASGSTAACGRRGRHRRPRAVRPAGSGPGRPASSASASGVPSRVNGALRTTTGAPSASRTTTSNSACGSRPRQRGERGDVGGSGHAPQSTSRLYGAGAVLLPGVLGGAVDVVGAGRITNGRSPGFTSPYFSRASRSISESVLSRFDSPCQLRVLGLQHLELRAGLVGLDRWSRKVLVGYTNANSRPTSTTRNSATSASTVVGAPVARAARATRVASRRRRGGAGRAGPERTRAWSATRPVPGAARRARGTTRPDRAPPRCAGAGCTWRPGRCARARRS